MTNGRAGVPHAARPPRGAPRSSSQLPVRDSTYGIPSLAVGDVALEELRVGGRAIVGIDGDECHAHPVRVDLSRAVERRSRLRRRQGAGQVHRVDGILPLRRSRSMAFSYFGRSPPDPLRSRM
jgi:hypothetical protein